MKRGGILDSKNYYRAVAVLKRHGIRYADKGFGFDRYYWYSGLYRVSGGIIYKIYADETYLPFRGICLDSRECPVKLRSRL